MSPLRPLGGLCCVFGVLLGASGCGKVAADVTRGDGGVDARVSVPDARARDAGVDTGVDAHLADARVGDARVGDGRIADVRVDVVAPNDAAPDAVVGCIIDGGTYANNQRNPESSCESCRTVLSTSIWEYVPDGIACDGGKCLEGECMPLACPSSCGSNEDCTMWCPPIAGTISCCDPSSGACFMTGQAMCPAPPPPSQCSVVCATDLECQTQCIGFSVFCCDTGSATCVMSETGQCPTSADAG